VKCYCVDYGYGQAHIWIPDDADALKCFSRMANDMFGIRKSITEKPTASPDSEKPPETLVLMALRHGGRGPMADLATFDAEFNKIMNECGKFLPEWERKESRPYKLCTYCQRAVKRAARKAGGA